MKFEKPAKPLDELYPKDIQSFGDGDDDLYVKPSISLNNQQSDVSQTLFTNVKSSSEYYKPISPLNIRSGSKIALGYSSSNIHQLLGPNLNKRPGVSRSQLPSIPSASQPVREGIESDSVTLKSQPIERKTVFPDSVSDKFSPTTNRFSSGALHSFLTDPPVFSPSITSRLIDSANKLREEIISGKVQHLMEPANDISSTSNKNTVPGDQMSVAQPLDWKKLIWKNESSQSPPVLAPRSASLFDNVDLTIQNDFVLGDNTELDNVSERLNGQEKMLARSDSRKRDRLWNNFSTLMKARDPQNPSIAHDTPGSENNKKGIENSNETDKSSQYVSVSGPYRRHSSSGKRVDLGHVTVSKPVREENNHTGGNSFVTPQFAHDGSVEEDSDDYEDIEDSNTQPTESRGNNDGDEQDSFDGIAELRDMLVSKAKEVALRFRSVSNAEVNDNIRSDIQSDEDPEQPEQPKISTHAYISSFGAAIGKLSQSRVSSTSSLIYQPRNPLTTKFHEAKGNGKQVGFDDNPVIVPVSSVASDVIRPASESTADIKLDAKGKRPHFFSRHFKSNNSSEYKTEEQSVNKLKRKTSFKRFHGGNESRSDVSNSDGITQSVSEEHQQVLELDNVVTQSEEHVNPTLRFSQEELLEMSIGRPLDLVDDSHNTSSAETLMGNNIESGSTLVEGEYQQAARRDDMIFGHRIPRVEDITDVEPYNTSQTTNEQGVEAFEDQTSATTEATEGRQHYKIDHMKQYGKKLKEKIRKATIKRSRSNLGVSSVTVDEEIMTSHAGSSSSGQQPDEDDEQEWTTDGEPSIAGDDAQATITLSGLTNSLGFGGPLI